MNNPATTTDVRAAWPDPLYLDDLTAVLGARTRSGARRLVIREGIAHGFIGRRIFVRRDALAAWFTAREAPAVPRSAPPPVPKPPAWAVDLLKRRHGRGS